MRCCKAFWHANGESERVWGGLKLPLLCVTTLAVFSRPYMNWRDPTTHSTYVRTFYSYAQTFNFKSLGLTKNIILLKLCTKTCINSEVSVKYVPDGHMYVVSKPTMFWLHCKTLLDYDTWHWLALVLSIIVAKYLNSYFNRLWAVSIIKYLVNYVVGHNNDWYCNDKKLTQQHCMKVHSRM